MKRMIASSTLLACMMLPGSGHAAQTVNVFMNNSKFCATPVCTANANTTIAAGDTVTWIYADPACTALAVLGCSHTVTRTASPTWNSGSMPGPGGVGANLMFSRTFTARGTFSYLCTVHGSGMSASIVVQ